MERFDDDTLFAELRQLRPSPRPDFAAELDERVAAGFPRGDDTTASVFAPLVDWWRGMSPRGRLMPVLAAAAAVVVLATVAVAISESGGGGTNAAENAALGDVNATTAPEVGGEAESTSGAEAGGEASSGAQSSAHPGGQPRPEAGPSESGAEMTYEPEVPAVGENRPYASHGPAASGGAAEGGGNESAEAGESEAAEAEVSPPTAGGGASLSTHRDIEQSAYVILGTKPSEVSGAAAKVFAAVHTAHGIVLHSSVSSGSKGATGAIFELLIPSAKVNDALAEISAIAEVRARHDSSNDITAPTVSAQEELADSGAAIEGLLNELGDVETEAERESVEARLHEERSRHASLRASLDHLHERAAMSEVTVRIVTGKGAGVHPGGGGSGDHGNWGVGDALHDAGHILTIATGVVLIALAIFAPIGLIALLFWAGNRVRIRRLRERALG